MMRCYTLVRTSKLRCTTTNPPRQPLRLPHNMHIAIVGAGIHGLCTATELAQDGHHVTIYEQHNAVGEGSSFAPGAWSHAAAAPLLSAPGLGLPLPILRQGHHALLHGRAWPGSQTWRWLRQWQHHAQQPETAQTLQALSTYSQRLHEAHLLRHTTPEPAEPCAQGALVLLRSAAAAQQLPPDPHHPLLTPATTQALEPGLSTDAPLHSARHIPGVRAINTRLWAQHLRHTAQELGIRLWTGAAVQRIHTQPIAVQTQDQNVAYDAIVLCTGTDTQLLQSLGVTLPTQPLWGYTVTAPVRDALLAPRAAIFDWHTHTTVARIGQRLRISAGACLGAHDPSHEQRTVAQMYAWMNDWFPGAALLSSAQVQIWRGMSALLPDGLPALGATPHPGIWVNLAHGTLGASLASGCARIVADLVQHQSPALPAHAALHPQRFTPHPEAATPTPHHT